MLSILLLFLSATILSAAGSTPRAPKNFAVKDSSGTDTTGKAVAMAPVTVKDSSKLFASLLSSDAGEKISNFSVNPHSK